MEVLSRTHNTIQYKLRKNYRETKYFVESRDIKQKDISNSLLLVHSGNEEDENCEISNV